MCCTVHHLVYVVCLPCVVLLVLASLIPSPDLKQGINEGRNLGRIVLLPGTVVAHL